MNLADTVTADVRRALREDVGAGDLTADLLPSGSTASARVISRETAVLSGSAWFEEVFRQLDSRVSVAWEAMDGAAVEPEQLVCRLHGPTAALVTGERTALNFLQLLSGTATVTREHVKALGESSTQLLDTRKTVPGLRLAQKHAVRCGGGVNHRLGLFDALLIKENHVLACGSVSAAVAHARARHPGRSVECEVESLAELEEAVLAGADIVLLDNFSLQDMGRAVKLNAGRARLEVSGNVELKQLAKIAATGVDYISCGGLTKHVRAVDFSMRIEVGAGD